MSRCRMREVLWYVATVAATGCSFAPASHSPVVVAPLAQVHTDSVPDAALFDSLARAVKLPDALAPGAAFAAQGADALAWLDVMQDSALVAIVRAVLRDNRDLHAAIGRVREYRALVGSQRSLLFPEIDGSASASTNQIAIGASAPISYDAVRATVDLQWELDFWGRIRKGVAAADADAAAQSADERSLVLTLVADAANAYLELLESRAELDVSQRTLASRQSTLGLARQRYSQGLISELDVRQFEADVAGAASSVAQFTRAVSVNEHALSLLMGQQPGPIVTAAGSAPAIAAVAVPDSIPASLLLRRPDVISAERSLAAADARVGATRAALFPRFVITGDYGRQAPSTADVFGASHEVYSLQLGMSVPLFAGGRQTSELAAVRARVEQARSRYEQTVLSAMREAADALVGVRTYRDQLASQTAQAMALRDAYRLAERRYEGGIASYLEVLEAQRGLFAAEIATTQSQRLYLEATVQLYKALGGRWSSTP